MKKIIFAIALLLIATACAKKEIGSEPKKVEPAAQKTEKSVLYTVDTTKSTINWEAHKVTGQHNGTIGISNGTVYAEQGVITAGSINVDMSKIGVTDLKDEKSKQGLIKHISSKDFFDVEKYPTASLEITGVKPGNEVFAYKIDANLTIKGIAKHIVFPASVKENNGELTITSKFGIDRTEWDIKYGSGKFFKDLGDKVINDEIGLDISIVAKK